MKRKNLFILKFNKTLLLLINISLLSIFSIFSPVAISKIEKDTEEKNIQQNIYLLGPGDIIQLNVIDVPELSSPLKVLPDGTISLPLSGSAYVKDLSIDQAKHVIENKLSEHLLVPEVQVTINNFRPLRVTLIGEVQAPGLYLIDNQLKGIASRTITLVDAIQEAGGLTNKSDIKTVKVIRKYFENGKQELKEATFNLWELINDGNQENNPVLFDGDSILIKETQNLSEESTNLLLLI